MRPWPCIIVAALLAAAPVRSQPAAEPPTKYDLAAIDAYVARQVKDKGFVGLSVAVMRDGKIVFAKGYGKRPLAKDLPVEPDSSFAVGSITKQFTCACAFLLAEEGKLSIDDPVSKYFPDLTRAKDITVRDLMNHTSGYPDYYPLDFLDRRMLKPISFEGMLKDYAGVKLDFEPGTPLLVQQHGLHHPRRHRRQGGRRAVRHVPREAHPEAAEVGAFAVRHR